MKRRWLDIAVLLVAMALIGIFFIVSSPDETLATPITALPVLKRVLVVAACLLVTIAALLAAPKHADAVSVLATLFSGVILGALAFWPLRATTLFSSSLFVGSVSVYFFILAIKNLLALRSSSVARG